MDDIVKAAMAKWPNVPDCYGWLGLDARGDWYMRDAAAQACGTFSSGAPGAKGSLLRHEALRDFIGRNYAADAQGRWFFQNGPQRVFVELEVVPWVWRLHGDGSLTGHTGAKTAVQSCWTDEHGRLYLDTPLGLGLLHTQDVVLALPLIESGEWAVQDVQTVELPRRFGYVISPQANTSTGSAGHDIGDALTRAERRNSKSS